MRVSDVIHFCFLLHFVIFLSIQTMEESLNTTNQFSGVLDRIFGAVKSK